MTHLKNKLMKKIEKGPITEIFEGGWGNKLTTYVWGLPQYGTGELSRSEVSTLISDDFDSVPGQIKKHTPVTNSQLDKNQQDLLVENYIKDRQAYIEIFKNEDFRKFISQLYELEKSITLTRCLLEIDPKFTILKQKDKNGEIIQYIVARTLFFRKDLKRDEITFYVGRLEEWGNDLEEIIKNPKFMEKAINGLTALMVGYAEA